jgi:adenylate kinase family enzyme
MSWDSVFERTGRTQAVPLAGRRRIMVVGSGGSGKSTFARRLAACTGLPLIHLDRHFWNAGWVPTPTAEWLERVRELSRGETWIIDGNYGGSLSIRLERCDAVVFFDLSRVVCVLGVVRRWVTYRFTERPDIPEGCAERLDLTFLRWVWNYRKESRVRLVNGLELADPRIEIVRITRRRQVRRLLDRLSRSAADPTHGAGDPPQVG